MQQSDETSKAHEPSPEEEVERLLKLLDAQRASREARLPARDRLPSGMAFRYMGVVFIVLGTLAAVFLLEWMASRITHSRRVELQPMPTPPAQH